MSRRVKLSVVRLELRNENVLQKSWHFVMRFFLTNQTLDLTTNLSSGDRYFRRVLLWMTAVMPEIFWKQARYLTQWSEPLFDLALICYHFSKLFQNLNFSSCSECRYQKITRALFTVQQVFRTDGASEIEVEISSFVWSERHKVASGTSQQYDKTHEKQIQTFLLFTEVRVLSQSLFQVELNEKTSPGWRPLSGFLDSSLQRFAVYMNQVSKSSMS